MRDYYSQERMASLSRRAAAEGCVLMENKNETLPIRPGEKVALFGRIAFDYYKSGLGSGGLVNTDYVVGIYDALKEDEEVLLDQQLIDIYDAWRKENPYDTGKGWGQVPWSQEEMSLTEEVVLSAAERNDMALVVIGRTAGEDQDIRTQEGAYYLSSKEKDMIRKVCKAFKRAAVVLNVGSPIDMSWVEECHVPAVLYVWQGGQEGGNAVCDVLTGRINPSGRLADTIAKHIEDYPSTINFGNERRNVYQEDIYVGYRYFETFAKEKVQYPFGYGLSYTTFSVSSTIKVDEEGLTVWAAVANTGKREGKHSVLVYIEAPQGKLGKPSRVLAGFAKTGALKCGEQEVLTIRIPKDRFASYDDTGKSGYKNAFVLEEGTYWVYVGGDVRSAKVTGNFFHKTCLIEQCHEAYAPVEYFQRMRPVSEGGMRKVSYEETPRRTIAPQRRREENLPEEIPQTGDVGYQLQDVYNGAVSMEAFIAQLTDVDLIHLFRAEGMCSPKVTPGTAAAFGGLTESLKKLGIPAGCCADGPSGIRMDCGTKAFSLPNGVLLGCSFDTSLVEGLFEELGLELRKNRIDTILGPGLNIHRSPLNGRNFEYFSEDPLLTGMMGCAQLKGLETTGTTGTIKHFICNNQEFSRHEANGVVSQRAIREIYLKGFEYAVKEGKCRSIMTTYGPVNGIWTAGSYDLNTVILREEWGFDGIVMTDWWAKGNWEGQHGDMRNRAPMVQAQNDLYMVCGDATIEDQDDLWQAFNENRITRAELQRGARNILSFLLRSLAMQYTMGMISQEEMDTYAQEEELLPADKMHYYNMDTETGILEMDTSEWKVQRGLSELCAVNLQGMCGYSLSITIRTDLGPLAQLPISIYVDNHLHSMLSFQGTEGAEAEKTVDLGWIWGENHYIKFLFGADGMEITSVKIRKQ